MIESPRPTYSRSQAFLGVVMLILFALSWPASCECGRYQAQTEAEAICRRAIERKYGATAQEAEGVVKAQREWEGR